MPINDSHMNAKMQGAALGQCVPSDKPALEIAREIARAHHRLSAYTDSLSSAVDRIRGAEPSNPCGEKDPPLLYGGYMGDIATALRELHCTLDWCERQVGRLVEVV